MLVYLQTHILSCHSFTEADKRTETLDQGQRAALVTVTVQQVQWHQRIMLVPICAQCHSFNALHTWAPLQAMGCVIGKEL